jgi:hypothetical protein
MLNRSAVRWLYLFTPLLTFNPFGITQILAKDLFRCAVSIMFMLNRSAVRWLYLFTPLLTFNPFGNTQILAKDLFSGVLFYVKPLLGTDNIYYSTLYFTWVNHL